MENRLSEFPSWSREGERLIRSMNEAQLFPAGHGRLFVTLQGGQLDLYLDHSTSRFPEL